MTVCPPSLLNNPHHGYLYTATRLLVKISATLQVHGHGRRPALIGINAIKVSKTRAWGFRSLVYLTGPFSF